jgi:amino acid transporter
MQGDARPGGDDGVKASEAERHDLKRAVVGRPLASDEMDETLLRKLIALPVFASDPLSSVAYATEAALVVLVAASLTAAHLVLPISAAIAALLTIVVISYRQTVRAYATSGGAYIVAKDNLGTLPSLVAAAALLVDYVLTVAVSVAAGVFAITSAAPSLGSMKVELSLGFIVLLTLANLRGVKEAGILFAIPTYGFVAVLYAMIGTGVARCALGSCPQVVTPHPLPAGAVGAVGIFVLLKAFASGSAALTGVEAISNGVSAFRPPQARNAARTLAAMGVIAITLFLGVSYLAVGMHVRPSASVSVLSQIARGTFPAGSSASFLYYAVQALTFAILVLAANTSYQGFPRLAALLARDRFIPRQFVNLGDRLVYSNGIVVLAGLAVGLIVAFGASVDSLINLYVIGVFTAFTISQSGMVVYWRRRRERGWRRSAAISAVGACVTGLVLVIVVWTKFAAGAWSVTIAVPALVASFYGVRRHYRKTGRRLRAGVAAVAAAPPATNTVLVHVHELDEATQRAVWFARRIAGQDFRGLYVQGSAPAGRDPRGRWWELARGAPLDVLSADEGHNDAVLEYVWSLPRGESQFVTVVLPERFERRSVLAAVRRSEFRLKLRLLAEPSVVIADVPVVAGEDDSAAEPERAVCRVLVSGAHAASLRAVHYAETLGVDDAHAVFFAFDAEEASRMRREWLTAGVAMPLEVVEAPYRDLGEPLLDYVRGITADEEALAIVVMPELVVRGAARLLHNQRALYVKRLLLFEPRVVLASVPYQLP